MLVASVSHKSTLPHLYCSVPSIPYISFAISFKPPVVIRLAKHVRLSIAGRSLQIEIEYKNVKVMRHTVYPPDGRVKITAPVGTDKETIKKFASSKIGWIEKHRRKFMSNSKSNGPLKDSSVVYVWGAALQLEVIERKGHPKIVISGGTIKMYIRPGSMAEQASAKKQELLDKWYRNALKEAAPPLIKKWEKLIGVEVKKLYVRKMKTHWGSCNYSKQTMRLNSELAKRCPECLEYVIVHEMLHIIEKGHNSRFYSLLTKYLPNWKSIRKQMNTGL